MIIRCAHFTYIFLHIIIKFLSLPSHDRRMPLQFPLHYHSIQFHNCRAAPPAVPAPPTQPPEHRITIVLARTITCDEQNFHFQSTPEGH